VSALSRQGDVHEFEIPKDVFENWDKQGYIKQVKDYDFQTGTYNYEVRFDPKISTELNKYKKK
jgi:hypothetical protein